MIATSSILEHLLIRDDSPSEGEGVQRLSPYHWCYLHTNGNLILKHITQSMPLKEEYAPQGFVYHVWGPDTPLDAIWDQIKQRYLYAATQDNLNNLERWCYLAES